MGENLQATAFWTLAPGQGELRAPQVDAVLQRDEQGAVGCGRTVPRARAGARHVEIDETTLDGLASRDAFGHHAAARVTGTDEKQVHWRSHVPDEVRRTFAQRRGRNGAGTNHPRSRSRTIDDRRRVRWRQPSGVEHAKLASGNRIAPLLQNLGCRHRRRYPWQVRAGRRNRIAIRLDEARERRVWCPTHCDAAFRSAEARGHAAFTARKHERHGTWPVACRDSSGGAREM